MREPVYLARDTEIIRQITIKDFDNFEDHVGFIESDSDSLFGKSLFLMSGKKWKQMRSTLSPAFTGNINKKNLKGICHIFFLSF